MRSSIKVAVLAAVGSFACFAGHAASPKLLAPPPMAAADISLDGVFHSVLLEKGQKGKTLGYITSVFTDGELVHFKRYDVFKAPFDVAQAAQAARKRWLDRLSRRNGRGEIAPQEGYEWTYMGTDANNDYYFGQSGSGQWVFVAVNKASGQITVIDRGFTPPEVSPN